MRNGNQGRTDPEGDGRRTAYLLDTELGRHYELARLLLGMCRSRNRDNEGGRIWR